MRAHYGSKLESAQLVLPREIALSLGDQEDIGSFRKKLITNKFRHHAYNPSYDVVFNRLLYKGLPEAAERKPETQRQSISEFVAEKKTYIQAIALANSEAADRFQNPLRSFPKKPKPAPVVELSKKQKRYYDKEMTEHDKAVDSLWHLFDYYRDREHMFNVEDPVVKRRAAVSIKEEK